MALTITTTPSLISYSRHPLVFVINSDDAAEEIIIEVEIYNASGDVFLGELEGRADADGNLQVDVSKYITDNLSYGVPDFTSDDQIHVNQSMAYYIKAFEIIDDVETDNETSVSFKAILGANDWWLTESYYTPIDLTKAVNWLTAKPLVRELYTWQEEMITVLFTTAVPTPVLKYVINYNDGGSNTVTEELSAAYSGQVRSFSMSFRQREFYSIDPGREINNIELSFDGITGDTITYRINLLQPKWQTSLIGWNKKGGLEVLAATGVRKAVTKTEGEKAVTKTGSRLSTHKPTQDIFSQNTGNLPKEEIQAYIDMMDINKVYRVLPEVLQLEAIDIDFDSFEKEELGLNLRSFQFNHTAGPGRQNYPLIYATEFNSEGGEVSLPINQTDVINLVTDLAAKKNLSDEGTEIDFGTNGTAWNFQNKQSAIVTLELTADITAVFSNNSALRSWVAEFDVTGIRDITLNSEWLAVQIPNSCTWDSENYILTIDAPIANTIYNFFAWKVNSKWKFNISEEEA